MTIRSMAQSYLMNQGFFIRGSSFTPPPDWQNPRANNQPNVPVTDARIRTAGYNINSAIDDIRDGNANRLEGRTSNADVATVEVNNARLIESMMPRNTSINVRQTATAQTNEGEALESNERAVDSGAYTFEIEAGGRTQTFNINVLDTDDNASIQARMAAAVNASNIGITATVQTQGTGDEATTRLTFTASETGTDNTFAVTDVSGNLAETMGVNETTAEAQNAVFSINNGAERQSQTNQVNIAPGVTATLQGEGQADINFRRDNENLMNAVTDLVNSLNASLQNVNPNAGSGSSQFVSDIRGMNFSFASSLARVGIQVGGDGRLSINETQFERAAEDGSLSRMFEDGNFGFMGRASNIASNAANSNLYRNTPNPVNFMSPGSNFDFGNVNDTWAMMNLFQ
ncbi:MAG: hypothetical protein FWF77_00490 [Defluviitaleaceae bacterium]|nr:hypothetical protein [Defluviitaleaceae bacterium]